jgi:hypothetical protein
MALIIKSFRQILKQRKGRDYKPRSKKVCYKCGKPGHFIAKCPISSDSDRGDDKKGRRKEKKKYYKKKGGWKSHRGVLNRANLKFINLSTTTCRVSVRNMNESEREGEKQIAGK